MKFKTIYIFNYIYTMSRFISRELEYSLCDHSVRFLQISQPQLVVLAAFNSLLARRGDQCQPDREQDDSTHPDRLAAAQLHDVVRGKADQLHHNLLHVLPARRELRGLLQTEHPRLPPLPLPPLPHWAGAEEVVSPHWRSLCPPLLPVVVGQVGLSLVT